MILCVWLTPTLVRANGALDAISTRTLRIATEKREPDLLLQARHFLATNNEEKAELLFKKAWQQCKNDDVSRKELIAIYLGISAEANGKFELGKEWYQKAGKFRKTDAPDLRSLLCYVGRLEMQQAEAGSQLVSSSPQAAQFVMAPPDPKTEHLKFLEFAREKVCTLRDALQAKKNDWRIEVRLMAYLFSHAELGTDNRIMLYETSQYHFAYGMQHRNQLESNGAKFEDYLGQNIETAMIWDFIRVRYQAIQEKNETNIQKTKQRHDELRKLTHIYRDASEKLTVAMTKFLLKEDENAEKAMQDAVTAVTEAKELLEKAQDLFLVSPEPNVQQKFPELKQPDLIVFNKKSHRGHLLATKAFLSLETVLRKKTKIDVKAIETQSIPDAKVAQAVDPGTENLLADYTLLLANEAVGAGIAGVDVTNNGTHAKAAQFLKEAKKQAENASKVARERSAKDATAKKMLAPLIEVVDRHIAELTDPKVFLDRARDMTSPTDPNSQQGDPEKAYAELIKGLERHQDPNLVYEAALAMLRAGFPIQEIEAKYNKDWQTNQAVPDDNYRTYLVQGRILLQKLQQLTSKAMMPDAAAKIDKMVTDKQISRAFSAALNRANIPPHTHLCMAYHSYSLALEAQIQMLPEDELIRADKQVRLAIPSLTKALQDGAPGINKIDLQEGLIVGYLAAGHLAVLLDRDYEMSAVPAFAAALQENSKLPFGSGQWSGSLGSPLLLALKRRSAAKALAYAEKERKLRRAMDAFVRGAFALEWKGYPNAVSLMTKGMDNLDTDSGEESPFDSIQYKTEYTSQRETIRDDLLSYKALSEIILNESEKKSPDQTIVALLRYLTKEELPGDPDIVLQTYDRGKLDQILAAAKRDARSPLLLYALARGYYARTSALGYRMITKEENLLRIHNQSWKSADTILDGLTKTFVDDELRRQYGNLAQKVDLDLVTLNDPKHHEAIAKKLVQRMQLEEAQDVLKAGLALIIEDSGLWSSLMDVTIDVLKNTANPSDAQKKEPKRLLKLMTELTPQEEFTIHFLAGKLHEANREYPQAYTAFKAATEAQMVTAEQRELAEIRRIEMSYKKE